jgi:PAS domain S-box-containing protein
MDLPSAPADGTAAGGSDAATATVPARLALVDEVLASRDAAACAAVVLAWLADQAGLTAGWVGTVDRAAQRLQGLAGLGHAFGSAEDLRVDLSDPEHPLASVLGGGETVSFTGGPAEVLPEVERLLGDGEVEAVPLLPGPTPDGAVVGLLLASGLGSEPVTADNLRWAARLLGTRMAALGHAAASQAQLRAEARRDRLNQVLEAVTDPILLTDSEGRMLLANSSAQKLLTSDDRMSEGRRRAVALNNLLFSATLFTTAEDERPQGHEVPLVDPIDGQDLLFELLSRPLPLGGGDHGLVSILRNVTDLRRATEEIEENYHRLRSAEAKTRAERDRLDLILNSAQDPILVTDPQGNTVLMNPPAERLFTVANGGSGRKAERRVRANDAVLTSFVSDLYAGTSLRWRGELTLTDPESGDPVPVEAIAGKVTARPGEETGVVTILHDLSEAMEKARLYEQVKRHSEELRERVREATAELAEQNELLRRQALELEQASAMKSQFLANVSHELRTPLNAVMGYTTLLLDGVFGKLDEPQEQKLERIDANARHLLSLINELLDLTRIEAGKMEIEIEQFHLHDLVQEVVQESEPLIEGSKLELRRSGQDGLPALVSDRTKIKQILLNLLSNALKFTPEGSVEIRIRYERSHDRVTVEVEDTGIGIPLDKQEVIFEAFGQTQSSYARQQGGTGLGLSICRRLAGLLGGTITLESEEGEGSTFTLVLPRVADEGEAS